jgi:two-component system OmpR family response regulator
MDVPPIMSSRKQAAIAGGSDLPRERVPVVLVVDDHDDTREMYVEYLDAMGVRTVEAKSCAEALAKAKSMAVDAVVLDRKLPDGDGLTVCRTLKSDGATSRLAVIVLSGQAQDGAVDADAYLMKPIDPDLLLREIQRLVR